ncbi:MAG: nitrogenase component 1 [Methanolinea sp.]|nr:nitrogenase component 1 [Methanolinea sp.]
MHELSAPLWPCSITGAAAALAPIKGVGVIIHGSTGCFYYPSSALHLPLYCSAVTDQDVILGSEGALARIVGEIKDRYALVAILCTCIPSITGEDIRESLTGRFGPEANIRVIDVPGFAGEYEEGFRAALRSLDPPVSGSLIGPTISGLSPLDPFYQGNIQEAKRLLPPGPSWSPVFLCTPQYSYGSPVSPYTIHANPDLGIDYGEQGGTLVGIRETRKAILRLEKSWNGFQDVLEREIPGAEQRIIAACDRYLKRFDPPDVALFGQRESMLLVASMLEEYLDAGILVIGSRNQARPGKFPVVPARDYGAVEEILSQERPDLVLGSSFERQACPEAAFVGVTPPLRGSVRLHAWPFVGIEGALVLMESVLNACMDHENT